MHYRHVEEPKSFSKSVDKQAYEAAPSMMMDPDFVETIKIHTPSTSTKQKHLKRRHVVLSNTGGLTGGRRDG